MKKPMSPKEIKKAIAIAGYSQVDIAVDCEVSASFVNRVINGKATSHRVCCYIAEMINRQVDEVWHFNRHPSKPGPKFPKKPAGKKQTLP